MITIMMTMTNEIILYVLTSLVFLAPWPILFYRQKLTSGKMIFLLFCLDMALTIEAALYGEVVMIALLHLFTIPAFFSILYFSLRKQSSEDFRCFVCGKIIDPSEEMASAKRGGLKRNVSVHASCIDLDNRERKAFSERKFRKGIPQ